MSVSRSSPGLKVVIYVPPSFLWTEGVQAAQVRFVIEPPSRDGGANLSTPIGGSVAIADGPTPGRLAPPLQLAGESTGRGEAALSARELGVLELLSEGLSNPSIAARLSISRNTVKTHVRNIVHKLDVANRTQAALVGGRILQESSSPEGVPSVALWKHVGGAVR